MLINKNQKEDAWLISILKAGTAVRVGNRNTKTMYESGETAQVASEMKSYTTCLLRLSETRNELPPPITTTTNTYTEVAGLVLSLEA